MALAGDHAQNRTETWRAVAQQFYLLGLSAIAIALLIIFPPHFDLHLGTVIPVILVAGFLVLMERPVKTPATTMAPLTAVISASGVVFGDWTIVLAVVALACVRMRAEAGANIWKNMLSTVTLGQMAIAVISAYAVLAMWRTVNHLMSSTPHVFANFTVLLGVLAVGLTWQTVNNVSALGWLVLNGRRFVMSQLLRTGIVASIYAYLLVATYKFGGLLASTIFYIVVAQIRIVQDVLGIANQLHKLEKANQQALGLARDLIKLTSTENVEFASEVENIAQMMGRTLGMPKRDVEMLGLAAELHEMGMAHIPARIRYRTSLNPKELAQKLTYTRWGGLMVRAADALLPTQIADWIEFHGEHFDGTGYPRGLKGEDIPIQSRIIAVARAYVRLLTGYDSTEAVDKEKALTLLRESSGTLYDPRLVKLLYEIVS